MKDSDKTAEEERKARQRAIQEDREERMALRYTEEEKVSAAKSVGINVEGTWAKRSPSSFKPLYDPPHYGSIHYWLAYAREILLDAKQRRAHRSEVKCAIIGLNHFANSPKLSIHNIAANRIQDQLISLAKGYSRLT
jgi:hypothetical protein